MGYNVIDIIDKCIYVENEQKNKFQKFMESEDISPKLKVFLKVFLKDKDRIINYYNKLKEEVMQYELEEIDFRTYDKISFLINEYNIRINSVSLKDISPRGYLKVFLELSKDEESLFIDLQGRLYNNASDSQSNTYKVLSDIIEYTKKHTEMIEKTIYK